METTRKLATQDLILWRKQKVIEFAAQGKTMTAMAEILKVDVSTISKDLKALRQEAKEKQQDYIENELPFQHKLAVANLDKIIGEAWRLYDSEGDSKAKLQALNVISEAVMKKQAVLGDPEQIEQALKLISKLRLQQASDKSNEQDEPSSEEHLQNEETTA